MSRAIPVSQFAVAAKPTILDKIAGFLVPCCLFVEPANSFFLTDATVYEVDRFAIPLSLVISPIFLLFLFHRGFQEYFRTSPLLLLVGLFAVYCLVMGATHSITRENQAVLYAYQWILPFLWLPYFLTIIGTRRFEIFCRWLFIGVVFNLAWYASSAVLEFAFYGGLGDAGRMTQNLILPGQYQIAVYVPTAISLGVSLVNGLFLAKKLKLAVKWMLLLNGATLVTLLALAAREGLLTYLLATVLLFSVRSSHFRVAVMFGSLIVGSLLIINLDAIFEALALSDLRILNKIANLQNEGARFGGRDVMISESLRVFYWDPLFGSRFLPPNTSDFNRVILAPSAHNMYVDAFVWCGLFGGVLFLGICLRLLVGSIAMTTDRRLQMPEYMKYFGVVFLVFLVLSNNTNVPMRQPIVAPLVALMIAVVMHHATLRRRKQV